MNDETTKARRRWLRLMPWPLAITAAPRAWAADDYPSRTIRLVVPFPVGGSSDNIGRMLAERLAPLLKQSVVVENRAGAGGMIGTDAVAKAAPDGYSLVLVDVFHTTTPVYTRKMPYDAVRDFTPVSLVARSPLFLVTNPAFEARSLRELSAWAKANPGRMTMAIAGTGSVVTDLFRARSGLPFTTNCPVASGYRPLTRFIAIVSVRTRSFELAAASFNLPSSTSLKPAFFINSTMGSAAVVPRAGSTSAIARPARCARTSTERSSRGPRPR